LVDCTTGSSAGVGPLAHDTYQVSLKPKFYLAGGRLVSRGAIYQGETVMLRKTMIALFTVASIGMLAPSVASARGGGGFGGGGGFHGGGGFGGGGFHGGGFGGGGFHGGGFGGGGFRGGGFGGGGFRSAAIASGGFRSEPSQPMVSAAAVSTTGADSRSVHLITAIRTTTTATTAIPTMAMAAATWCGGACIPGMVGVSNLSRCAADPGFRRMEGDDLVS
jgi:hypothetical protein